MAEKCKICNSESKFLFNEMILNKYNIDYYRCLNCGFVQTEFPYWLKEAYASALGNEDTGILKRNYYISTITSLLLTTFFNKDGHYLDFAGGYGIFTRLMRDKGFNFFWSDPYAENLVARGFEWDFNKKADLVTSIEAFEHFDKPLEQISEILQISKNVLFTTQLFPFPTPKPKNWWYYSFAGGQHIAFHTKKSLNLIAIQHGLNFYTNGKSVHFFTEKKLNPLFFNLIIKIAGTKVGSILSNTADSLTESDMKMILLK